jgi:hypothetical protein
MGIAVAVATVLFTSVASAATLQTFTTYNNAAVRTAHPASNYNGATMAAFPGMNAPSGSQIGGMLLAGFNVSAFEGYQVIGDATLKWGVMWTQTPLTFSFGCHAVLSNWSEGTVTWNNFIGSDVSGSHYMNVLGSRMSAVTVDSNTTFAWTVSNEVMQAWLDNPDDYHGLALVPTASGGNSLFVARYATWWPDKIATLIVTVDVKQVEGPVTNVYALKNEVRVPNAPRFGLVLAGYTTLDSPVTDEMLAEGTFEGLAYGSLFYLNAAQSTPTKWVVNDGRGLENDQPNGFEIYALLGDATGLIARVTDYIASERAFYLDRTMPVPADDTPIGVRGETNYLVSGWIDTTNCEVSDDVRAGALGSQSIRIGSGGTLTHQGDSVAWDNTYLVRLTGTWVMNCWAKSPSGNGRVRLDFRRWGGSIVFSQNVQPGTSWQFFSFTNSLASDPLAGHMFIIRAQHTSGGDVLLDDWSVKRLGQPSGTVYRDYVMDILRDELQIGSVRYFIGSAGTNIANLFAPREAQKFSDDGHWIHGGMIFSVPDVLTIAERAGARSAWLRLPVILTPDQAWAVIEFLAGPTNTYYGNMRAQRGHPAPWTDSLIIYFELGNEVWFSGNEASFADMCTRIFGIMRESPWFDNQRMRCVLGGQAGNTWRSGIAIPRGKYYDVYGLAPYTFGTYNQTGTDDTYGPLMAFTDYRYNTSVGTQLDQITTDGRGKKLGIYELNMHTTSGSSTDGERNIMLTSAGAAVAGMDTVLQHMYKARMPIINVFSMRQYWYIFRMYLWGIYRDYGMTQFKRPYAHAQVLANRAVGNGSMLVTEDVDVATWFQAEKNGVSGSFPYTKVYAFCEHNVYRIVALNRDWKSNRLVSVALPFSMSGAAGYERFAAPGGSPWASCETNDSVCWSTGSMAVNGTNLLAELPPNSGTLFYLTNEAALLHTLEANVHGLGKYDHDPGGTYPEGMLVPVVAYPDDDSSFAGWGGDLSGMDPSHSLVMSNDMSIVAFFNPVPEPWGGLAAVCALAALWRRRWPR